MAKRNKKNGFKKNQQAAIKKNQVSTPGIVVSAGEITASEFDRLDRDTLMADITNMRDGDAIPSTTLDVLKLPIQHSEMRIEPGIVREGEVDRTQEAADYIQDWLENRLFKGFDYFKRHQLLSLDYGHIIFEEVLQRGVEYLASNGKREITNIITRFAPIQYDGIHEYIYDEKVDFAGIIHDRLGLDGVSEFINIPGEKLYLYSHNEEFGDVRGRSELRTARLSWSLKQKVLTGGARAIQRGVLPIITIASPALEGKAHQIGRTMGNTDMAYIVQEKDKVSVEMAEVKNQGNLMEMLSYLDRQMFFNTLSQFMTSGLGENGSRAATSELKSSYELKANAVLQEFESHMQTRVNKAMGISYLAGIPKHQWPVFHLGAITQADLTAVAGNLKTLADSNTIRFTDDDEKHFREVFGLPEAVITQRVEDKKTEDEPAEEQIAASLIKNHALCAHRELHEFERKVFEFESANSAFEDTQEEIDKAIQEEVNNALTDIAEQLEGNLEKRVHTRRHEQALFNKLVKIYTRVYSQGESDVKKEFKKINSGTELQAPPALLVRIRKSLNKAIERLFNRISKVIESEVVRVTPEFIEAKGGLQPFILGFGDGFKGDKRTVRIEAQAGYTDGRGATIEQLTSGKGRFFYSAMLDNNLCEECAPLDGTVFTGEEIAETANLQFNASINLNCLGDRFGNQCRCQWIIQSVEGEQ